MLWVILGIIFTIIIVGILKDAHGKLYKYNQIVEEFELETPRWAFIIIILISMIPILNIIFFIIVISRLIYLFNSKLDITRIDQIILNLNKRNLIGKILSTIKNFLIKNI